MTETPQTKLTRTAYHEAGHAVAHTLLSSSVEHVSIIPSLDEVTLGSVRHTHVFPDDFEPDALYDDEVRPILEPYLITLLAGPVAENIYSGAPLADCASNDIDRFARLVTYLSADTDAEAKRLEHQTHELINTHWPVVETLAIALLDRREMTGDEVREIIANIN